MSGKIIVSDGKMWHMTQEQHTAVTVFPQEVTVISSVT